MTMSARFHQQLIKRVNARTYYIPLHHQRPRAPFTVILETPLCDEADVHPDGIVIGDDEPEINANNSEDIRTINNAEVGGLHRGGKIELISEIKRMIAHQINKENGGRCI